MRNHSHVVHTRNAKNARFDLPHHVVSELQMRNGTEAVSRCHQPRDASIRIAGRQFHDRHRARYVPHFAGRSGRARQSVPCLQSTGSLGSRQASDSRQCAFCCSTRFLHGIAFVRRLSRFSTRSNLAPMRACAWLNRYSGYDPRNLCTASSGLPTTGRDASRVHAGASKQCGSSQRRILEIVDDQHVP